MTQEQAKTQSRPAFTQVADSYYGRLGLYPSASALQIRRAYRELSKRYHPDTTELPTSVATAKFQQLNEAYATLSNPERRTLYDAKIGYSRFNVIQVPPEFSRSQSSKYSKSAYLDPSDRPLSAGEIFALFILLITFLGCLLLAFFIGLTRGEEAWQVPIPTTQIPTQEHLISQSPANIVPSTFKLKQNGHS